MEVIKFTYSFIIINDMQDIHSQIKSIRSTIAQSRYIVIKYIIETLKEKITKRAETQKILKL
jgi:hypothetical protein